MPFSFQDFLENLSEDGLIWLFLPLTFVLVYMVHEWGHYCAARFLGVRVHRFSIGAGPVLFSRHDKQGTYWEIKLFPIYGHVMIAGRGESNAPETNIPPESLLENRPLWQQALIVGAGPAINFILPFFLLIPVLAILGKPVTPPVITGIAVGEPADLAGFALGDVILSINGYAIDSFGDIGRYTHITPPEPLDFVVDRQGERIEITVLPEEDTWVTKRGILRNRARVGLLGQQTPYSTKSVVHVDGIRTDTGAGGKIDEESVRKLLIERLGKTVILGMKMDQHRVQDIRVFLPLHTNARLAAATGRARDKNRYFTGEIGDNIYVPLSPREAVTEGARMSAVMIGNLLSVPFQLVPLDTEKIAAPVTVSAETSAPARALFVLAYLTALISIVTAMINLVPFPGLDGSRMLLIVSESLIGTEKTARMRGRILCAALGTLYIVILFANLPNVPRYIESRMTAFEEFRAQRETSTP